MHVEQFARFFDLYVRPALCSLEPQQALDSEHREIIEIESTRRYVEIPEEIKEAICRT